MYVCVVEAYIIDSVCLYVYVCVCVAISVCPRAAGLGYRQMASGY